MSEQREWQLQIPAEGVSFSAVCSHVEGSLYRLESISFAAQTVAYGDTFDAEEIGGTLRLLRIRERAGRRNCIFVLTHASRESEGLTRILTKIEQHGGVWERALGGLLGISLPAMDDYDPTSDVIALNGGSANRRRRISLSRVVIALVALAWALLAYRGIHGDPSMRLEKLKGLTPAKLSPGSGGPTMTRARSPHPGRRPTRRPATRSS